MAIPGYDASTVAEYSLEQVGARVAVVATVVPETFGLSRSDNEVPAAALSAPVDLVACDELRAVEAIRITLDYDPTALPPGASPTDVAVAVETGNEWQRLHSTVDLEETTVTAVLNDQPPGSSVAAVYDDRNEETGD
ncbi:hypothetical protein E2L06_01165 [Haloterrigena sp. H1]|uniref:hypothetical protein n=1 Tax=Haloterrigena sp. H1 TaxID=2552943 RepID=UPI00110E9E50|nr:hypothetical protein [Haloterrigena sp. H1]TMT85286.1 hypothetical protein E2L06_01165 [Haloterrigena sp. H1]